LDIFFIHIQNNRAMEQQLFSQFEDQALTPDQAGACVGGAAEILIEDWNP
jgi:hypothetical protein